MKEITSEIIYEVIGKFYERKRFTPLQAYIAWKHAEKVANTAADRTKERANEEFSLLTKEQPNKVNFEVLQALIFPRQPRYEWRYSGDLERRIDKLKARKNAEKENGQAQKAEPDYTKSAAFVVEYTTPPDLLGAKLSKRVLSAKYTGLERYVAWKTTAKYAALEMRALLERANDEYLNLSARADKTQNRVFDAALSDAVPRTKWQFSDEIVKLEKELEKEKTAARTLKEAEQLGLKENNAILFTIRVPEE